MVLLAILLILLEEVMKLYKTTIKLTNIQTTLFYPSFFIYLYVCMLKKTHNTKTHVPSVAFSSAIKTKAIDFVKIFLFKLFQV